MPTTAVGDLGAIELQASGESDVRVFIHTKDPAEAWAKAQRVQWAIVPLGIGRPEDRRTIPSAIQADA